MRLINSPRNRMRKRNFSLPTGTPLSGAATFSTPLPLSGTRSRVRELRFPARGAKAAPTGNLPYASLGPLFKGRDVALAELRQRLWRWESGTYQAIHGLGGVGKTRLAIEYAWRHATTTRRCSLLVCSPVELRANFAGLCNPLVLTSGADSARGSHACERRIALAGRVSRLAPNSRQRRHTGSCFRSRGNASAIPGRTVIITSRIADWSPAVQTAEPLNVLDETEAAAFLLERTEAGGGRKRLTTQEAVMLAREMGGLALALEQAGAYVAKNRSLFRNTGSAGSRVKPRCSPGTTNA